MLAVEIPVTVPDTTIKKEGVRLLWYVCLLYSCNNEYSVCVIYNTKYDVYNNYIYIYLYIYMYVCIYIYVLWTKLYQDMDGRVSARTFCDW